MDSTERELQSVRDKERKKNDSEEDDDSDYQNNEEETDNDDESNDEDNPIEEEVEREGEEEEEEVEEEEENELMDTTGSNKLCCAGDLCTHEFGQEIIGLSHRCRSCNGRLHGFLCSNEKSDELIGMVCKQCEADAMEFGESTEGGNEKWQVQQRGKTKSKDKSLTAQTSTLMSIMRTGSNYVHSRRGRGRGGSSAVN